MNITDPHFPRATAILKEFPEVRKLYGYTPITALYALACWSLSVGCAVAVYRWDSWLLTALLTVFVGPFADMMALVVMHEVCHNLVFRKPWQNRLLGILVNTTMAVPISEVFRQHHLAHHLHLGDDFYDVDVPTGMETRLVQNGALLKFLWLLWMPFVIITRSLTKLPIKWNRFVVLNWVSTIGPALFFAYVHPKTFVFLFGSAFLSQSIHPANVRAIQRHVASPESHLADDELVVGQPNTYSYYGPMNLLTLNVGFHVEHHDFARVPWGNLPALHKLAGEKWYPRSLAHKSRSLGSLWNFVTDSRIYLDWYSARQPKRGDDAKKSE